MGYTLITGATGFIGRHLLRLLENSQEEIVDKIVLLTSEEIGGYKCIQHKNYSFTKDDFSEAGVDVIENVIHLGAFTPKLGKEADDISQCISNVNNLFYLINNLPCVPRKFIFSSTLDVYKGTDVAITEQTETLPATLYGWSKLFGEKLLEKWAAQNKVVLQILRIGHIYGSGEESYKKLIPVTISKIHRNESPEIYSDGSELRSFLHVSDCVKAILNSLKLDTYVNPINVVSDESHSIIEIVTIIKSEMKSSVAINIRNEIEKSQTKDLKFDASKMEEYLLNERTSFQEGIIEEINNFKFEN